MKKSSWLTILMVLVLALGCLGAAQADLIPPHGEGQMGIQAVVVYNGQPIYSEPDEASKAVRTLDAGSVIILVNRQGDWAEYLLPRPGGGAGGVGFLGGGGERLLGPGPGRGPPVGPGITLKPF